MRSRMRKIAITVSFAGFIGGLLALVYTLHSNEMKEQAADTAVILVDQIKNTIYQNKIKEQNLEASLKEDYTIRAKNISYILDNNPNYETDLSELTKIANLTKVDEIHLFDETGTIYSGTVPQYYNYSFDSGEQMAWFRPMLSDKTRAMCQDLTPNTAEKKLMMYAICWNEDGTRMTQVGIEPHRLMAELKANDIYEIVRSIPSYKGVTVIVANKKTEEILGSTSTRFVGQKLRDAGINIEGGSAEGIKMREGVLNGEKFYYTVNEYWDYYVTVMQKKSIIDENALNVVKTLAVYILIVIAAASLIVHGLIKRTKRERKIATTDVMTGLLNRRGYERALVKYMEKGLEDDFVYGSIDLNGLKQINDSLGHAAGDEMIKAAAECLRESFGAYGKIFRIGGDEFAAIIRANGAQLEQVKTDFEKRTKNWRGKYIDSLSASCGCVRAIEFPNLTLQQIIELADQRMYAAKRDYYEAARTTR